MFRKVHRLTSILYKLYKISLLTEWKTYAVREIKSKHDSTLCGLEDVHKNRKGELYNVRVKRTVIELAELLKK